MASATCAERAPRLRTTLADPEQRRGRRGEALIATARIILLGLATDAAPRFIEVETFHPTEAMIIAPVPAFVLLGSCVAWSRESRAVGSATRQPALASDPGKK